MSIDPAYTNSNQRSSTLNANTPHDTGLYDPSMHDDQIVAMYETAGDAQVARDTLVARAIAADAQVMDHTPDRANAGVNSEGGNTGLWGSLKSLFAPDDEVHGYAEGVRRGHALLVVHPAAGTREQVIEAIAATNPIDFDAKLEQWRSAGWNEMQTDRPAGTMPSTSNESVREIGQVGTVEERARVGRLDPARSSSHVRAYIAERTKR